MTTTLMTDSSVSAEREAVAGRLTFEGVVRSEWIKLLSLRSIRWSIGVMLVLSWGGGLLLAYAMGDLSAAPEGQLNAMVVQSASFGSIFTILIMAVIGVLSMTSEYASGLILSSLAAVPQRSMLFAGKALVVLSLSLVVGALSTFGAGALAAAVYGSGGLAAFIDPAVLLSMLGTTIYLVLGTLLAFGLGVLLRSSAGGISVATLLFFVVTLVFQMLTMTGWEWVSTVGSWMPANLGHDLSTSAVTPEEYRSDVPYWGALVGLCAWTAAVLVPAGISLRTRDAV